MITVEVAGARGGHGATTVARALAYQRRAESRTSRTEPASEIRVSEVPRLGHLPKAHLSVWVLRGPDVSRIEALGNARVTATTELVVVHEPWRAVLPERAAELIGVHLFAVVRHDPEVALAIDGASDMRGLQSSAGSWPCGLTAGEGSHEHRWRTRSR